MRQCLNMRRRRLLLVASHSLCCGMSAELVVRNRWRNLIALRRMLRWLWGGETQKGDHVATIEVESTLTSASSAEPILVSCLY